MSAAVFTTIVTGVSVFILGQILVKCALEPYIAFKEQLGNISALLLREQSKILSGRAKEELVHELKQAAALLIAKSKAIPFYSAFAKSRLLPNYALVIEASRHLNLLASILHGDKFGSSGPEMLRNDYSTLNNSLKAVGNNLGIVVTYQK